VARLVALGAVLLGSLSGCNQFQDLTAPYVGTWQIVSGTDTADCGKGPGAPMPVTGSVIVGFGAAPLMLSVRDTNHGTCVWVLDVSRANATLRSGPECAATTADVNDAAITPKDYLFTLSSNHGATVASTFDWTILGDTCRHMQQETLLLMTSTSL
jgi:hypothetical protein